eukprot:g61775.t1
MLPLLFAVHLQYSVPPQGCDVNDSVCTYFVTKVQPWCIKDEGNVDGWDCQYPLDLFSGKLRNHEKVEFF